jgi:single-strand DNA-binding protein
MSYADINRVVLVGRLTRDPELRALPSGSTVCGLRIACNGVRKDGDVYQERPNYFDVYVFGAQGENVERYLHKSSRVALAGRLEWREWETADAHKRQAVSIVADFVQCLDPSTGSGRSEGEDDDALDEDDPATDG